MIRVFFMAVLATCVAGIYPIHRHVLFDPQSYDLLYNSSTGSVEEKWYLSTTLTMTAFILPSRVKDCISDDLYNEDITVTVRRVVSSVNVIVASGSVTGQQAYGKEIYVSLFNTTSGEYPKLSPSIYYFVKITWSSGLYPWHLTRTFSTLSGFHSYSNSAGYIIGVEYSL